MKSKLTLFLLAIFASVSAAQASDEYKLIAFIGEKISVEEFEIEERPNVIVMDAGFIAKYRVEKILQGNYESSEIEFKAYDHYGVPKFSNFSNVILFVSEIEGNYYHVKYQYFDVYKTVDGRWASCGKPYGFDGADDDEYPEKLMSVDITFTKPISYDISAWKQEIIDYPQYKEETEEEIESRFPSKYFAMDGNQAVCRGKGIYAEDLARAHSKYLLKYWD